MCPEQRHLAWHHRQQFIRFNSSQQLTQQKVFYSVFHICSSMEISLVLQNCALTALSHKLLCNLCHLSYFDRNLSVTVRNTVVLHLKPIILWAQQQLPIFLVHDTFHSSTERQLVHRVLLSLNVNEQVELEVSFCSDKPLSVKAKMSLQVEDNQYSDTIIRVSGEAYQEIVSLYNISKSSQEIDLEDDGGGKRRQEGMRLIKWEEWRGRGVS